jgi:hypothetical protein
VRNALAYVLGNFRKHGARRGVAELKRGGALACGIDPYSSGEWFDGWREWRPNSGTPPPFVEAPRWSARRLVDDGGKKRNFDETAQRVVAEPRTWLAVAGWRRHGLIALDERPAC